MAAHEAVQREGDAWVLLMSSGAATRGDLQALRLWRGRSAAHEAAFREAVRLYGLVRGAATEMRAEASSADLDGSSTEGRGQGLDRRRVMTGALAASVAGLAVFAGGRAFQLWSQDAAVDFATAKGERRVVALADGVSAELNTLTRLSRRPGLGLNGVELLSGEVLMTSGLGPDAPPLVVLAGDGRTIARAARFGLRCDEAEVAVTCLEGSVLVEAAGGRHRVPPGSRLTYGGARAVTLSVVDTAVATAWRRGVLVFQREPLRNVVAEINRYRPGRIVLADDRLANQPVTGTFYVTQIDEIFDQVRSAFGARVTRLPGGVVVLA